MRNFVGTVTDVFSNKIMYALTFLLSGALMYYSKITSDRLHLENVEGIRSLFDYVIPQFKPYLLGISASCIAVILFVILAISSLKLFYGNIPALNIGFALLNIAGFVLAAIIASPYINAFIFLIMLGIVGIFVIKNWD